MQEQITNIIQKATETGSTITLDKTYTITHDDEGFYFGGQGPAMSVTFLAGILGVAINTGQSVEVA